MSSDKIARTLFFFSIAYLSFKPILFPKSRTFLTFSEIQDTTTLNRNYLVYCSWVRECFDEFFIYSRRRLLECAMVLKCHNVFNHHINQIASFSYHLRNIAHHGPHFPQWSFPPLSASSLSSPSPCPSCPLVSHSELGFSFSIAPAASSAPAFCFRLASS